MTAPVRLEKLAPESLAPDQREVYDAIAGGPRATGPQLFRLVDDAGRLEGPFNAFLLQPRLGAALQAVGAAVRYESTLSDRAREVAILVVAVHWQSEFEWYAHEAVGRHAGLSDGELAALRDRRYDALPADVQLVARVTDALVAGGDLADDLFEAAEAGLGLVALFELTTLVGYYGTLALQLKVFRVALPDG